MDNLLKKLMKLYLQELINVNIGYTNNPKSLELMWELMNAIDLIKYGNLTRSEFLKIITYYEK